LYAAPVRGTDLALLFDGWVLKNVTDGKYEIEVKWEGIEVYDEKGDLSKLLKNQTLPISNGTFCYLMKDVPIPDATPAGSFAVTISAADMNGKEFTCFVVKFSLSPVDNSGLNRQVPLFSIENPPPSVSQAEEEQISHPMPLTSIKLPSGVSNYKRRNKRQL